MASSTTQRNSSRGGSGASITKEYQQPYGTVTDVRTIRTAEPSTLVTALSQAGLYHPPAKSGNSNLLLLAAAVGAYLWWKNKGAIVASPVVGSGSSSGSVTVVPTTPMAAPSALGTPDNLRVLGATASSVIVAVSPVLGARYYEWHDLANNEVLARSSTEVAVIDGLQENTDYDVYVVVIGSFGAQSQPSSPLLIKTTTGAPTGVAVSVNVPAVTVNLNVPVNANITLQYIGPVNIPVTPTSGTPNFSAPAGVSTIPVSTSTQYAKPTSQIVDTPSGPAQALSPSSYALGLQTNYSAAQVFKLSNGTTNLPAVMPIPLSPTLDPSSSAFNPQAIVETANEQSNQVPSGYPFASYAQSQTAVNWWVRTHPQQPLPPDLPTVAQGWFAAGSPS